MAATQTSGQILDQVNSLAGAVTGVSSYQGRKRWAEADNPEQTLRNQAAETKAIICWFVEERYAPAQSSTQNGTVTIRGQVTMRLNTQTSSDTDLACDLMDEILVAVMQEDEYDMARPTDGRWSLDNDSLEDDIANYFISLTFSVGPLC